MRKKKKVKEEENNLMEIKVDRDQLFKCISRVQSIIEQKSNMPILSMVLLTAKNKEVSIAATDLEIGLQQILPGNIIQEGSIAIPGRKLFEILGKSNSRFIHIKEKENNWVYISDKIAHFNLACMSVDNFPPFEEPKNIKTIDFCLFLAARLVNKIIQHKVPI